MTESIKSLKENFPCESMQNFGKGKHDFSHFHLTNYAPAELIELFEEFGAGTFYSTSGDAIELLPPSQSSKDELMFVVNTWNELLLSDEWDHGSMTIPKTFFESDGMKLPENFILWGRTHNGVLLSSLLISDTLGWVVLLLDGGFANSCCFFKSPANLILDAFFSPFLSGFFPASTGPYWFESK